MNMTSPAALHHFWEHLITRAGLAEVRQQRPLAFELRYCRRGPATLYRGLRRAAPDRTHTSGFAGEARRSEFVPFLPRLQTVVPRLAGSLSHDSSDRARCSADTTRPRRRGHRMMKRREFIRLAAETQFFVGASASRCLLGQLICRASRIHFGPRPRM